MRKRTAAVPRDTLEPPATSANAIPVAPATSVRRRYTRSDGKMNPALIMPLKIIGCALAGLLIFKKSTISMKVHQYREPSLPSLSNMLEITTAWTKMTVPTNSSTASKIPLNGPIPNHLFLSPCKDSMYGNMQVCTINQEKNIRLYKEAWDNSPMTVVTYLTKDQCSSLVGNVEPRLVDAYKYETEEENRSEICRLAALYLYGGVYLDVEVLQALVPKDPTVSFVVALEEPGKGFFQSFLASTPHHPILEYALERMVTYYDKVLIKPKTDVQKKDHQSVYEEQGDNMDPYNWNNRTDDIYDQDRIYIDYVYINENLENDPGWRMGERTLKEAYAALPASAQGNVLLLQEIHLHEDHSTWYPDVERRESPTGKCCCNYGVHDPRTKVVHFWSKLIGSDYC